MAELKSIQSQAADLALPQMRFSTAALAERRDVGPLLDERRHIRALGLSPEAACA